MLKNPGPVLDWENVPTIISAFPKSREQSILVLVPRFACHPLNDAKIP